MAGKGQPGPFRLLKPLVDLLLERGAELLRHAHVQAGGLGDHRAVFQLGEALQFQGTAATRPTTTR